MPNNKNTPVNIGVIPGTLEIDFDRGVIYFTPSEGPMTGGTLLRLQGLTRMQRDKPIDIRIGGSFGGRVSYDG